MKQSVKKATNNEKKNRAYARDVIAATLVCLSQKVSHQLLLLWYSNMAAKPLSFKSPGNGWVRSIKPGTTHIVLDSRTLLICITEVAKCSGKLHVSVAKTGYLAFTAHGLQSKIKLAVPLDESLGFHFSLSW